MLYLTVAKVVCLTVAKVVVCRHDAEYQHLLLADILVDNDREAKRLTGTSMAVAHPCVGNTCAATTCRQFLSQVYAPRQYNGQKNQHQKRSASYNDDRERTVAPNARLPKQAICSRPTQVNYWAKPAQRQPSPLPRGWHDSRVQLAKTRHVAATPNAVLKYQRDLKLAIAKSNLT